MSTKTHINARQIKAARALLDWSQEDLAAASGLSIATIRKIESGAMSPRDKTMGSIVSALEEANIEFTTPDGVRLKDQNIMVIEGVDCFLQLTEDIYYTMKGCGSDCIRFMNGDSSRMNSIEWASLVKLRKASMRFRILIKEGNTNLHLPLDEYRWVPAAYFRYNLLAIYKNKVAISVYEKDTQQDMHKVIVSHATKTFSDRARSILSKQERLAQLDQIRVFTYNPNGENLGKDSLNHSEVIKIGASFLTDKPTMQRILVNRFPVLLIDESQDTNKLLMESFFAVQNIWKQQFCLGLFGDMMQRIYADGKPDLGRNLPPDWARPAKTINHRSPKRIIRLINKIRAAVDEQEQKPRSDKEDGWVRIFILPSATEGKPALERKAANHMQTVTGDPEWQNNGVKTLILEHHMAAHRMGFLPMFEPLYKQGTLNIGLLDGSLAGIKFFSDQVLPLIKAQKAGDKFKVAAIVRKFSPLLSKETLKANPEKQSEQILKASKAVEDLLLLWGEGKEPRFVDVLRSVQKTGLFEIPGKLQTIASRSEEEQKAVEESIDSTTEESEEDSSQIAAWDKMLISRFAQLEGYIEYIQGRADFDTHQGVKGLQFPRVMVIIDDESARGFLFSYDKLFGAKGKTKTDIEHEQAGEETGIDRTRRLLYVTCSRAQQSLAIVCYSANPQAVQQHVLSEGWFDTNEILMSL